jgi:hypothetical protein
MFKKLPWIDRVGVMTGWLAVLTIFVMMVFGKASLFVLLLAAGSVFMFTLLLVLSVFRTDDNPDNDTVTAAAGEVVAEARAGATSGWLSVKGLFVKADPPPTVTPPNA